jgi:cobalt-zinc-cadmium efflux system membrane fusion protein
METTDPEAKRSNLSRQITSAVATVAVGVIVIFLLKPAKPEPPALRAADAVQAAPVLVTAHGVLTMVSDTPLAKKITFATVSLRSLSTPLIASTGAVVARLTVGSGAATTTAEGGMTAPAWDFGSPDLFSTYTAWLQSQEDVKFNAEEVAKIRVLDQAKVDTLQQIAERLKALVRIGSDAPKDQQAAESDLLQGKLQMEKDVYEAEKALNDARKNQDNLARQLVDADADPTLLVNAREGTAIVAADVPESRLTLIHEGAACQAIFYALPDVTFTGQVGRLGSVVSKDRRTMRVLFVIEDPQNRLRSNMFAEVGLGTDARQALTVPVDALLHDGEADYVLVETEPNVFRATEVEVGDPVGGTETEILQGLKAGDRIAATGTILLKPYVVQSLEEVP